MRLKDVTAIMLALVENLFYSGTLYGWPFFEAVLKDEGFYSELCPNVAGHNVSSFRPMNKAFLAQAVNQTRNSTSCEAQAEQLNFIFTASSTLNMLLYLVAGLLLDKAGTWLCKGLSTPLYVGSFVLCGLSFGGRPQLLLPSFLCLAAAGALSYMVNFQFANLFPSSRSTLLTVLNGLFVSSAVVFWLVQMAYDRGVSIALLFYAFSPPLIFMGFLYLFLSPRDQIPNPLPPDYQYGLRVRRNRSERRALANVGPKPVALVVRKLKLFSQLGTALYACVFIQFTVTNLSILFYIGSFDAYADTLGDAEQQRLKVAYGVISLVGGLASLFAGLVDDLLTRFYKARCDGNAQKARQRSSVAFALFSACVGLAFSTAAAIPSETSQYVAIMLLPVLRVTCYICVLVSTSALFPSHQVATQSGAVYALGGAISLLRVLMMRHALQNSDFVGVRVACAVLSAGALVCPLVLRMARKRIEAELFVSNEAGPSRSLVSSNDENTRRKPAHI